MEIQRQSDYYGLDRPEPRQAHLTADQIAALISGPQITPGLLNTRTAWRDGQEWTYAPENFVPEDEDVYEPNAEELDLEDELESRERYVPEDLVERRREGFRTAAPVASPGDPSGGGGASEMDMALAVGPENAPKSVGVVVPSFGAGVDMMLDYINDETDEQYGIGSDNAFKPAG